MLRLLRAYIINVVYYRRKALRSAKYNRYANSMYCNIFCYKELASAGASALISWLPANVGCPGTLKFRLRIIQSLTRSARPEHFSPVGVLLTESRCCLDQLAMITSPSSRLGNLRMVLSRDRTKVFKFPEAYRKQPAKMSCKLRGHWATENNIEVFVVQILYRLVRTAQALREGSCLCFLHLKFAVANKSNFLSMLSKHIWYILVTW